MVVPLVAVLIKGLSLTLRGYRDFLENYPVDVIVFRALKGKKAVYPFDLLASYGAGIYERGCPRFRTLDAAVLMPSAFTPGRLFLIVTRGGGFDKYSKQDYTGDNTGRRPRRGIQYRRQ